MFLVGLRRKEGLEQPFNAVDLPDVTQFFERSDALAHDWSFAWTIVDFLDGNGMCGASINRTGVVTNRDELALIIKHRPILLNKVVDE